MEYRIDQATQLRRGIEKEMDFYKSELIKMDFSKTTDGKQLVDLTVTELREIYENVKCRYEHYKKMPLYDLSKKCNQGDKEAIREWRRRWESEFPKMGGS